MPFPISALARAVTLWALLILAPPLLAHDIPNDIAADVYVRPAGERLQLLVRVPLAAMRDVDYPRRGPGFLDLTRAAPALREAAGLWLADKIEVYEGGRRLGAPHIVDARISLESDKSFVSFETAMAHLKGPRLPNDADIYWNQALLDTLIEYPIESERSAFAIQPRLERLGIRTTTVLRFVSPDGTVRAFEYRGDAGLVKLDPRWHHAALRFVESGFLHILTGVDHLLFVLCLVIPFRRLWPLFVVVTAFTVAHSITLGASMLGLAPSALWFPPLIETLIAVSILYMALENVFGANVRRRWMLAFGFGLVHGFAFAFDLKENLQFAGDHLALSLLSFNAGVELGQLLALVVLIPVLNLVFRFVPERMGVIVVSVFVAHTAWHWMIERGEQVLRFPWAAFDAASLASLVRWVMLAVAVVGIAWLVAVLREHRAQRNTRSS